MADPIPQGKWHFLENAVAHCKVMGHYSSAKRLNRPTCRFGRRFWWAQRTMLIHGADPPRGRVFFGEGALGIFAVAAAAFAAKRIIQSPITPCSRRDHWVCQTSANSRPIMKICGRRPIGRERGGGIAQHGRSLIPTTAWFLLCSSCFCANYP